MYNGTLIILGFGKLSSGGPYATALMQVEVPIVSDNKCAASYGSDLHESMICAARQIQVDHLSVREMDSLFSRAWYRGVTDVPGLRNMGSTLMCAS